MMPRDFVAVCGHEKNKYCPISKTPCLGICVFSDIMENVSVGIIVCDVINKEVIFQNQSAIELLDSIRPKDFESICALLIPNMEAFLASASQLPSDSINHGNKVFGYTAYKVSERFIWIFIRDITEKVRLESIAEAVNTMNNIGYIFSGIRHEIGNPINSIKMAMSVLEENIDKYPKEMVLTYVKRTLEDVRRIEYLLKSLKNFNMYEKPDIQKVHIPSFVEQFLSLVKSDFEKQGITITFHLHPNAEWAYTDPRALQQVLLNLLANAADALEARENPEIAVEARQWAHSRILLRIKDNGCGMSHDKQRDLFKPFVTDKPKGTGLGLVIARKMLAKMASTIEIESSVDVGTTVKIIMPGMNRWDLKAEKELY